MGSVDSIAADNTEDLMIRLLLVDDQKNVRRGLRMRLELEPDVEVVGEADNGKAAIDQVSFLNPDIVLMDVEMPCMDGISATEQLNSSKATCSVVMLSLYDDAVTRGRAAQAGASAFVAKHQLETSLMSTIRRVVNADATSGSTEIC
jgi:DNA-binding NarL/FixJ family response regulator